MPPSDFVKTLYLGDRACKSILIDSWNNVVKMQVDCISRVRSPSGTWDYYSDEDVPDGMLVFGGVSSIGLANAGHLPNDCINGIEVVEQQGAAALVEISVDSVEEDGSHYETRLRITCKSLHIEDPARPGLRITT